MKQRIFKGTAVMLIILLLLSGCKAKEQDEPASADFAEDTVFTVGEIRVGLTEWYLYALPEASELQGMYGDDIWDFVVDSEGKTMEQVLKEDLMDKITYIKIVSSKAESFGIALNEDDELEIGIGVQDYMEKLTDAEKSRYGITEDIVRQILADNILAMKVYEHLTLNVDTSIPEEQVRHTVLQYIMIPKYYEGEDEEYISYTDEELETIRADAQAYLDGVLADDSITMLTQSTEEKYPVIELVADYETLCEKFPEELAGIAFNMRQDEINGIYDTDDAYFILDCVQLTEEESTNEARIKIIEARQKELFEEEYEKWEEAVIVITNYRVWDDLKFRE